MHGMEDIMWLIAGAVVISGIIVAGVLGIIFLLYKKWSNLK